MRHPLTQLLADNRGIAGRRLEVIQAADSSEADLYLYDAIVDSDIEAEYWGGVSPQAFTKQLKAIKAETINLRINSPGGSVFGARAIETALREHSAKVVVHIDGLAASAATFIAMAGHEVVISPGAMFMIHNAWTFAFGNAQDLTKTADLLNKIDGTLVETYAKRTGRKMDEVRDWMAAETWFTAEEAVAHGFADRVSDQDGPQNRVQWNLNAFLAQVARPKQAQQDPEPGITDEHRDRQQQRLRVLTLAPIA